MLIGLYGLAGNPAVLRYMFSEYVLATSELAKVEYKYANAIKVDKRIDHITCHSDGRFHVKTRDEEEIYIQRMQRVEPLGPNTPTFLHLMVISDIAARYAAIQRPLKLPYAFIQVGEDEIISLRGEFAGTNYPLEGNVLRTISQVAGGKPVAQPGILLQSGTLKGILWGHPSRLMPEALAAKPKGTILSLNFPLADGKWLIKTFIFE